MSPDSALKYRALFNSHPDPRIQALMDLPRDDLQTLVIEIHAKASEIYLTTDNEYFC